MCVCTRVYIHSFVIVYYNPESCDMGGATMLAMHWGAKKQGNE